MYMSLLNTLFRYVLLTTKKYNIDESHGLSHSMDVLLYSNKLYEDWLPKHPHLKNQERIIYVSAVLHDMCDKKYMVQEEGIRDIGQYLKSSVTDNEINVVKLILSTMSYSKVKKDGFPNLGIYQSAYHIVRESDLLSAYDFDRSLIYHINKSKVDIDVAYKNAEELFQTRVFKHKKDGLLISDYSNRMHDELCGIARRRMNHWNRIISKTTIL